MLSTNSLPLALVSALVFSLPFTLPAEDCNHNDVEDSSDIADGPSSDCDSDGVPDECQNLERFAQRLAGNTTGFSDKFLIGPPDDGFLGLGGQDVTYDFGGLRIVDGPGPDFTVYEIDYGGPEFDAVDVLVSVDGTTFVSVKSSEAPPVRIEGDASHNVESFASSYDLSAAGLDSIRFVKIDALGSDAADRTSRGFDLDTVGAIHLVRDRTADCDGDGVADVCQLASGDGGDCDRDGILDACVLATGAADDCNANGIPDGCESDCDGNAVPDACDLEGGDRLDCNADTVPDRCEIPRFPATLLVNETGFRDSTFVGRPDDDFIGLAGSTLTFDFGDALIVDGDGPDFNVYEVDYGSVEFGRIDVLVSEEDDVYISVKPTEGPVVRIAGDEEHDDDQFARSYDLVDSGFGEVRFVRIVGLDAGAAARSAGFDLDAIGAIHIFSATGLSDEDGDGAPDDCGTDAGFRRGDSDADGVLSITDPIASLAFQFLGEGPLRCLDAADFDDNGRVEVTDPIANLSHQFLGGDPPPAPGKDRCGDDPTADAPEVGGELGCESYPEGRCSGEG